MDVSIPDPLGKRIERMVHTGRYGSFESALTDILRRGMAQAEGAAMPPKLRGASETEDEGMEYG